MAKKNPAIKTGNKAYKPTKDGAKVPKGNKNKLMWRGTGRGK